MSYVQIVESDGSFTFQLPGNATFQMPPIAEEEAATWAGTYFLDAVNALGAMVKVADEIERDPELSAIGKQKRIEPRQAAVVEAIANRWDAINQQGNEVAAREAVLFKVPDLDPSHSAMAIEDREIRDWLRTLGPGEAIGVLSSPGNERLKIAVLRSPIPQNDELKKRTLESWQALKREANPVEAAAIDSARTAIEWSRRGLAQVAGISRTFLGKEWTNDRLVKQILTSSNDFTRRGYGAFGAGSVDAARVQRTIDYEARRRQQ